MRQRQDDPPSPTRWGREGTVLVVVLVGAVAVPLLVAVVLFVDHLPTLLGWLDQPWVVRLLLLAVAVGVVATVQAAVRAGD